MIFIAFLFYALGDFTAEYIDDIGEFYEVDFEKGYLYLNYPIKGLLHKEKMLPAPTQSLLQRWLREEKGLCISVEAYPTLAIIGKVCFAWVIKSGSDGNFMESNDSLQTFSTYELALEDALKYALKIWYRYE